MDTPSFDRWLSFGVRYLWDWFVELQQGRQAGMDGPLPLGWADMAHWAALTGQKVRPDEWRILRAMDSAFLRACSEVAARERQVQANPNTYSQQPMTAELFDAIF